VAVLAGYDAAHNTPLFQSSAEVRVFARLSVLAGVTLAPAGDQNSVQPRVAVKLQLLSQQAHAVDLAVGGGYRRDRYTEDDGALESFVVAARSVGRWSATGSGSFLTDLEGDDRKGDARLAVLRQLGASWQVGWGSSAELDLRSTDHRRGLRQDPSYEVFTGPIATWSLNEWVFLAQVGPALFETGGLHGGARGLMGVASAF
jgi:hypothetical protein